MFGYRAILSTAHTGRVYGAHRPDTLCSTQSVPITSFTAAIVWIAFAVPCPHDATNIHAALGYFPKRSSSHYAVRLPAALKRKTETVARISNPALDTICLAFCRTLFPF